MARRARAAPTEADIAQLIRRQARHWLRAPNVTSIGVGHKRVAGEATGALCVQFTVSRKFDPAELVRLGLPPLPDSFALPDGRRVPTDVMERRFAPAYRLVAPPPAAQPAAALPPAVIRRSRVDQVMPGVSIGRRDGQGAGTVGAIVRDALTGAPMLLGNWHVLVGPGGGPGDPVVQPGPWDDGRLDANVIGAVVRGHIGLAGDGAVASIRNRRVDPAILELGVAPARLATAEIGDTVVKSGRTTGVTYGVVCRTAVVVSHGGTGTAFDIGGFEIEPDPKRPPPDGLLSDEGDSGSLWLIHDGGAATDIAVGLHFGIETTPGSPRALACNLHSILKKLDATL